MIRCPRQNACPVAAVSRLVHLKCSSYYIYTTRFHVQKHSFLSNDSYSEVRLFPCPESTHLFLKLRRSVLIGQNELNPGLTLVLKGVENVNVHWSFKSSGMWQCFVEWVEGSWCHLQGQAVHEDPEDEGTAIGGNFGNYPKRGRLIPQELILQLHCSEILTSRTNVYCILIMKIIRKKLLAFIEYEVSMPCS